MVRRGPAKKSGPTKFGRTPALRDQPQAPEPVQRPPGTVARGVPRYEGPPTPARGVAAPPAAPTPAGGGVAGTATTQGLSDDDSDEDIYNAPTAPNSGRAAGGRPTAVYPGRAAVGMPATGGTQPGPPTTVNVSNIISVASTLGIGSVKDAGGPNMVSKKDRKKTWHGVAVALYTKKHLFPLKKFIRKPWELDYSTAATSICFQCLTTLNMDLVRSGGWWEDYKFIIIGELSNKRSNVAYGMRQEWLGKCGGDRSSVIRKHILETNRHLFEN